MARIIQKATLEGYVGHVGELCSHGDFSVIDFLLDVSVIDFFLRALITKEGGDEKGLEDQKGFWVNVSVWGVDAFDVHRTLKEGARVIVEGTLSQESYINRKPGAQGQTKTSISLRADNLSLSLHSIQSVTFKDREVVDQSGAA